MAAVRPENNLTTTAYIHEGQQQQQRHHHHQPQSILKSSTQAPSKPYRDQDPPLTCKCCPYGYHIDLDFVKYAADEARSGAVVQPDSLKLSRKFDNTRMARSMEQYNETEEDDEENDRREDEMPTTNRKSVYDNVPSTRRGQVGGGGGGKTIKPTAVSLDVGGGRGGSKLENQCLFSDSLENVMSDFEETLSRGGGTTKNKKDYSSDYEKGPSSSSSSTKMALNAFRRSPALKAGAGRNDGYASDCGYAVPTSTTNRPNTLRYAAPTTNHYYATPNTFANNKQPTATHAVEYASADAGRSGATGRSDSMSSLSSASSPHHQYQHQNNGGVVVAPSNSFESASRLSSRPSFDNSFNQSSSRLTPVSGGELLSPRLLTSSPLPPAKPSMGISGRVGAQIEQLAAHLNPDQYSNGRPESARLFGQQTETNDKDPSTATRRILELEHRIRAIPGPAFGGEKRRLQDELNRLVNEGKKTGYYRSITPTVLDTNNGGVSYATALARAMSSVAASAQQREAPEPPPRRESVSRMQTTTPTMMVNNVPIAPASRVRTYSANNGSAPNGNGSLNLDAFHSYRRNNNGVENQPSAASVVRPYGPRSASAGPREDADYVSDSEYALGDRVAVDRFGALRRSRHLLSRPASTLPTPIVENRKLDDHRQLVNEWKRESEERSTTRNGSIDRPTIIQVNGDSVGSIDAIRESKPLMRTIGVVTDVPKSPIKVNSSTSTAPVPQPKPCGECEGLRQRILELSTKPFTFTRGTDADRCTCDTCHRQSRLRFATTACGTTRQDTNEYRRDASCTAQIEIPCEECEHRNRIVKVSFGTNTKHVGDGIEAGSNTDGVEVRNRHVNTDQQSFRSCSINTDRTESKSAESMVDKAVLQACGGYRTITSNTTPPLMVTFGVNTDGLLGESITNVVANETIEEVANEIIEPKRVETREEGTSTDESYLESMSKKPEEKKEVETRTVAVGTSFVASLARMVDKYVDSTVRTRDVGTRTPPPPPPPLQPLRSSSSQTINEIKTMVSTGSGDCTLSLSECDSCNGEKRVEETTTASDESKLSSSISNVETQTDPGSRLDRVPSVEKLSPKVLSSTACGPDEPADSSSSAKKIDGETKFQWDSDNASLSNSSSYSRQSSSGTPKEQQHQQQPQQQQQMVTAEIINTEPKRRGIQRVFSSPKQETRPTEADPSMWTSQTSVTSDASSSERANIDVIEDSVVVCPLDEDEEEAKEKVADEVEEEETIEDESKEEEQSTRKFDFTKPRQTRAFALSKAAAAKKLLTSDTNANGGKQPQHQSSPNFQRSSVQSKSVRLDSKKGDSLTYITEKKQFQQATTSTASKNVKATSNAHASGLKGKVAIKKTPAVRKVTPAPSACSRSVTNTTTAASSAKRFNKTAVGPLPYQRRTASLPSATSGGTSGSSSLMTSSLKDEEAAAAEAEDIVGPLPSEVAAAAAVVRAKSRSTACYTNMATEDEENEDEERERPMNKLVGNVVDLPTKVEHEDDASRRSNSSSDSSDSSSERGEEDDEEEEDSMDEGSYDTNGNTISTKCDVRAVDDATVSEVSKDDDHPLVNAKFEMTPQLREACTTLNAHLLAGKTPPAADQVEWAHKYLQHEWLKTSASKRANPAHVGDFLDLLDEFSPQLLRQVVNYADQNENTALHYSVSRGHFDIVSLLLDTKMCNLNKSNKAGYTPVMLASLCPVASDTDSMVIQRLFQMGDVNIKASQHGQTALMLAVSHGNLDTTKLLLEAGAGVNIQDEEGSTALMCAAEHGHKEIVRILLAHPEIDASKTDNDNSTALSIAVENDHKDIGILIYAHLNYERTTPNFQSQSAPVWC